MVEQHTEIYDVGGSSSLMSMRESIDDHANRGWFVKCMLSMTKFTPGCNEKILVVYVREKSDNNKKEVKVS